MKLICLLPFSLFILSALGVGDTEDEVKKIIQDLKDKIPEPISFPNSTITIPENAVVSGYLNVSECIVTGLKAMEVTVKFLNFITKIPTGFSFELKDFQIHTGYNMEIPLFNISILTFFGSGTLSLSLNGLSIEGSISLLAWPKLFSKVTTSIDDAKFNITGFLDDSSFSEEISESLTKIIIETLNNTEFGELLGNVMNALVDVIIHRNETMQLNHHSKNELSMDHTREHVDQFQ